MLASPALGLRLACLASHLLSHVVVMFSVFSLAILDCCIWHLRVNTAVLCAFILLAAAGNARETVRAASHWLAAVLSPGSRPSLVAKSRALDVRPSSDDMAMPLSAAAWFLGLWAGGVHDQGCGVLRS